MTHEGQVNRKIEIKRLVCFAKLLNTLVGDAITDLLAIEVLLKHYDWTVEDWENMYHDLPSIHRKMKVIDVDHLFSICVGIFKEKPKVCSICNLHTFFNGRIYRLVVP